MTERNRPLKMDEAVQNLERLAGHLERALVELQLGHTIAAQTELEAALNLLRDRMTLAENWRYVAKHINGVELEDDDYSDPA